MKRLLVLLALLPCCAAMSEPDPASAKPLNNGRIYVRTLTQANPDVVARELRDLLEGKPSFPFYLRGIQMPPGIQVKPVEFLERNPRFDAPGPGYREQRERMG